MLEEAEKRDHRKLGREMDLFHFQEEGPGVVFWHAKGWTMFQRSDRLYAPPLRGDYEEVNAPQMLDKSLWETSGHWGWYRENMFACAVGGRRSRGQALVRAQADELPGPCADLQARPEKLSRSADPLAEFGVVHRYEPSGALHGLMRVRGFTQDDAHIFCTEEQLAAECLKINDLILSTYKPTSASRRIVVKLSTRPEKRVGSDAMWDHAEAVMSKVLEQIAEQSAAASRPAINPGEGAFYGPKFEYVLRDAIGRDWQCGTTQVDFNLPDASAPSTSTPTAARRQVPVMVHRAICGSMERFLGILIDTHAGHFPLWLAPVQVVVCTITSEADATRTGSACAWRSSQRAEFACEGRAAVAKRRSDARSSQREDQLQGPRAFALAESFRAGLVVGGRVTDSTGVPDGSSV
jgi:threonyl-tRNA synthetase